MSLQKKRAQLIDSASRKAIEKMCECYISRGQIAGMSACIAHKGETVYRKNFGLANIENKVPIQDDTIFRIFSMTKPVTVIAALMLWEEGRFKLDDPISNFIPAYANLNYYAEEGDVKPCDTPITIRHLLTMTSGMGYDFQETPQGVRYARLLKKLDSKFDTMTTLEFVNELASVPLLFKPGSHYNYSFSLDVVGALIEVVSGMQLGDFMEERIFKPLGMQDTAFHVPDDKRSRLCEIYLWNGNELEAHGNEVLFFSRELPCQSGGGGLMSTVDDYMAFTKFMLNNGTVNGAQLVKPETIQLMCRNQLDDKILEQFMNTEKLGYGYGFGVRSMLKPEQSGLKASIGEFGWDGAASTWTGIDPSSEVTAVFMLQLFPFCHFPAPREFQEIMYNAVSEYSKETS